MEDRRSRMHAPRRVLGDLLRCDRQGRVVRLGRDHACEGRIDDQRGRFAVHLPSMPSLTMAAGMPTTCTWSGTLRVTTAPAPTTECTPTEIVLRTRAPMPM